MLRALAQSIEYNVERPHQSVLDLWWVLDDRISVPGQPTPPGRRARSDTPETIMFQLRILV